jgi:uncharacterized protein YerC
MPRTSKKYFDKKFKDVLWDSFLDEIKKMKSGADLDVLLNKYLTPDEKILLEKRLGVFHLLKTGASYRKIGLDIDVTANTISFIKRGFKKPVKRTIKKNIKFNESTIPAWVLKKNSVMPTRVGKGRWKI